MLGVACIHKRVGHDGGGRDGALRPMRLSVFYRWYIARCTERRRRAPHDRGKDAFERGSRWHCSLCSVDAARATEREKRTKEVVERGVRR